MPDRDVGTIQDIIYYQYAKIIARRAFSTTNGKIAKKQHYGFVKKTFERLGCVISEKRKVEALYYIRAFGPEEADLRKTISIFGYPIFIKAV